MENGEWRRRRVGVVVGVVLVVVLVGMGVESARAWPVPPYVPTVTPAVSPLATPMAEERWEVVRRVRWRVVRWRLRGFRE